MNHACKLAFDQFSFSSVSHHSMSHTESVIIFLQVVKFGVRPYHLLSQVPVGIAQSGDIFLESLLFLEKIVDILLKRCQYPSGVHLFPYKAAADIGCCTLRLYIRSCSLFQLLLRS